MTVEIKKLSNQDLDTFIELIRVFEDVFEMKNFVLPDHKHLQQLLAKDSFFVFVALENNKVVGGLTTYTLEQYYSILPVVYIYDLAVLTNYQRQGIGKLLIASLNVYCKEIGIQEVFVQADEIDDYALDFYRATGGTPEKVVHFTYPLNTPPV
ncbi:GNAT family N-acetyltransferase [Adhaeribacter radiodurans]|uniref:GNAT family N-acetyltransferase n=1 Tax=Adhaeribacter radiodurans TaxID=2745197 RepID=A0A7L7LC47_9BACT|nr:GNAT family N-acetyltransferase [Adhaeribacter radiodurans]QMU30317.1 GNAT family N-acetyltransferase [Adhaeribacter radiodurans]